MKIPNSYNFDAHVDVEKMYMYPVKHPSLVRLYILVI